MHFNPPPYTLIQQPPPPPVSPELSLTLVADPTTHDVHISIISPKEPLSDSPDSCKRAPVDICCVIDVSGSMDSELKASLEEGKAAESTGLSTLDVVKHAIKTIVATTQPDDRIAIVAFSSGAKVIAELTPMTAAGKTDVLQAVKELHTLDSTNLWEGLKTGMNVFNGLALVPSSNTTAPVSSARLSTLLLLTDGMPNMNPPRGIVQMLQSYLDSHPPNFSIHTFGFGYSLDSQLLLQIARIGGGAYGFIPDASSLGAVFIHAVANIYSTCADRVELSIEYPVDNKSDAVQGLDLPGGQNATECSWGAKIEVGVVQYGQTRDFIVRMKDYPQLAGSGTDPVMSVTMRYRPWTHRSEDELSTCTVTLTRETITSGASEQVLANLIHHSHRFRFIRAVDNIFKSAPTFKSSSRFQHTTNPEAPEYLSAAVHEFKSILSSFQSPPLSTHTLGSALAQDITGEVLLSLSDSNVFTRWGRHYLPSLARYHFLQQCSSFRDPGLQVYGAESPLFAKYREELDQVFDSLPPPEPTIKRAKTPHASGGGQRHVGMSAAYAARSGPCFDGACEIALAGGKQLAVRDLRRGMRVETPEGEREVKAILETRIQEHEALLCELPGGLKITPWHPINVRTSEQDSRWVFPASQVRPELQACDAVYSVLLEPDANPDAHGVYIQGVLCVTLGHGITRAHPADARAHEFLGNYERIVQSLAGFPAAAETSGVYHASHAAKHAVSGLICGFVPRQREVFVPVIGAAAQEVLVT